MPRSIRAITDQNSDGMPLAESLPATGMRVTLNGSLQTLGPFTAGAVLRLYNSSTAELWVRLDGSAVDAAAGKGLPISAGGVEIEPLTATDGLVRLVGAGTGYLHTLELA